MTKEDLVKVRSGLITKHGAGLSIARNNAKSRPICKKCQVHHIQPGSDSCFQCNFVFDRADLNSESVQGIRQMMKGSGIPINEH